MSTTKSPKDTGKSQAIETTEKVTIDYKGLKKAALVLRAINHPLRQKMLELIAGEDFINVTKLYVKLRLEQSVASQHLAILRRAGFVRDKRDGKFIYYGINKKRVEQINQLIKKLNSKPKS